jgi:UDP:flavonoid glycosyltransferase YjiC (YdhE family)
VRVQRWIPQEELLPWCSAVVSQGGSGIVLGALAHGLPSVLLPVGADQPHTAARCADLGAAIVLDPLAVSSDDIGAAVRQMLDDPAYAAAARSVREDIVAMPTATEALDRLL